VSDSPTSISEASAGAFEALGGESDESGAPPPAPEGGAPAQASPPAPPADAPPQQQGGMTPGQASAAQREQERYRGQLREWENAFGGLHPDDQRVVRDVFAMFQTDPVQATLALQQITAELSRSYQEQQNQAAAEPPLTRSELAAFMAEQQQEAQMAQEVQGVQQEAMALGYQPGTAAYEMFLTYALRNHNGDLQAAYKAAQDAEQKVIDKYLASKQAKAMGSPPISPAGPSGTPSQEGPKTIEEASAGARAMLESA
jgi:hypothetical protein